ncbi:hypothetical protein BDR05DRAFT_974100 [Suillus weaverae]|nr:hypothetical protein BDR05DRAFT_974100 [Suillus weaverae]
MSLSLSSTTVLGKRKATRYVLHISATCHPCTYSGCTKSYSKACRLAEHIRSHTGEHTQKSHLPESGRPYVCTEPVTCQRRFWTFQHLQVHENTHSGAKSYACAVEDCNEVFTKHHQLRFHTCQAHAPPGTKPYMCTHPGCTKSFDTNQKLRSHVKAHDGSCAVYARVREGHAYIGRTFASQHNLRAHQKLHEQQELEAVLADVELSEATDSPCKRRHGGEVGRDWKCDKYGKESRPHLLERHLAKIHSTRSDQSVTDPSESDGATTTGTDIDCPDNELADSAAHLIIDRITGHAYSLRSRMPTSKIIRCPYPNVEDLLLLPPDTPLSGSSAHCDHILTRAYDLRRHLKAEHGLDGDKSKVDSWVRSHRGSAQIS